MRMRIFVLILFMLISSGTYAGEIYFLDNTVIKGTGIEIQNGVIKYKEADGKKTGTVSADKVEKIIYDDGTVLKISQKKTSPDPGKGVIFLYSGENIQFESLIDNGNSVKYIPRENTSYNYLRKNDIKDIMYGDPQEILKTILKYKSPGDKKREEYYRISNNKIHEDGFHSSILWFSLFGGIGSVNGDFDKYENRQYDIDKGVIINDDDPDNYLDNNQDSFPWGIDMNLLLYTGKMKQKRGFNLTGINFGIMGRYQEVSVYQRILKYYDTNSDGISEDEKGFSGKFMEYRSWQGGPTFDLIYSPRTNNFDLVFHSFIIGGVIPKGELTAVPGLRDMGVAYDKSEYSAGFKGYLYTLGTGIFFVMNRVFPVTVGLTFTYSRAKLTLDRELPLYDNRKDLTIHSTGLELSLGIHI